MAVDNKTIETVEKATKDYKYGFVTEVETEFAPKGLNEDIIRKMSEIKGEPEWMLDFRLKAYKRFLDKPMPEWVAKEKLSQLDFDDIYTT